MIEEELMRAIRRSERAYALYVEKKLFFQALRIYKANRKVYALLEKFMFECEEQYLPEIFQYLFHLEDWFESFHAAQGIQPALDDLFVFKSLPGTPKYPSDFKANVLKK